jgi:hypothetical protein
MGGRAEFKSGAPFEVALRFKGGAPTHVA